MLTHIYPELQLSETTFTTEGFTDPAFIQPVALPWWLEYVLVAILLLLFTLAYLVHELTEKTRDQHEAQPVGNFIYPLPKTMMPRVYNAPYTDPYLANGMIVIVK